MAMVVVGAAVSLWYELLMMSMKGTYLLLEYILCASLEATSCYARKKTLGI